MYFLREEGYNNIKVREREKKSERNKEYFCSFVYLF
jgi:hypothetical protein